MQLLLGTAGLASVVSAIRVLIVVWSADSVSANVILGFFNILFKITKNNGHDDSSRQKQL